MSTRSCIAQPVGDGWEGRYHHSDGYPTGLGSELWKLYHGHFAGDVDAMRAMLIEQHPAGWSCIIGADFSLPSGFGRRDGPECYCHGDRDEGAQLISEHGKCSENCDPLFVEWVYVLGDTGLTVFAHESAELDDPMAHVSEGLGFAYKHRLVGHYKWTSPEPNWESMEDA